MQNDPLYDSFLSALNAGIKQVAIADATGIPIASIRQFKKNCSLGRAHRIALEKWLGTSKFTQQDGRATPDVLVEVKKKLEACLSALGNPNHGRERKARIVLCEIEVLHREYVPELYEMGKL